NVETGQVNQNAAQVYDAFFVPALFAEPAEQIVEAASLRRGMCVLDVACGTGVLALKAAAIVAPEGRVTGLDVNEAMLSVARSNAPETDWRHGRAAVLPFAEETFDAVLSQFGLMFFEDRHAALGEMCRVVKNGGLVGIAVWDSLERSPGYAALTALLHRLFGADVASALTAPFVLGDAHALSGLFTEAGMPGANVAVLKVKARFPSLEAWLRTEVRGWTLAETMDDAQFQQLLAEARVELKELVRGDGSVAFEAPALLALARKA